MQLSMRTDYALRAIFALVESYGGAPVPLSQIARQNDIPKRFLEQIALDLKSQGWVDSAAGKYGGYFLSKHPSQITLGAIVRFFDGPLAPIGCVSLTDYKVCSQETVCRFRRVLLEARNLVAQLMDSLSLEDVLQKQPVKKREVINFQGLDGEGI